MTLILAAIVSVLYISNVIAVGRLSAEIGALEERHRSIQNEQELLRAEIVRLSGFERIRALAESQHGMKLSEAVPGWLTVDPDRVAELDAIARSAGVGRGK
jgi:cell division protein FtsL